MNTTLIALALAVVLSLLLLVFLGLSSLFSGTLNFLFIKPRLTFLKSELGKNGFAFAFDAATSDKVRFDSVKLRLFNPFGNPSQIEVWQNFSAGEFHFARDVDMGPGMEQILSSMNNSRATFLLEITGKDAVCYQWPLKAKQFASMLNGAVKTVSQWNKDNGDSGEDAPLYRIPERSFIADTLPQGEKTLKLAANPVYAGQFAGLATAGGGTQAAVAEANFSVSKVWIIEGCIVCDACENIYPEVFHVTADTCIVRDDYPKDNGLKVQEAAEACPVEVIKFDKA